jgi:hypothetical protein
MNDRLRRDFALNMLRIYLQKGPRSFRDLLEKYARIVWDDNRHNEQRLNVYLFSILSDTLLLIHRTNREGFLAEQLSYSARFLQQETVEARITTFIDTMEQLLAERPRAQIEEAMSRRPPRSFFGVRVQSPSVDPSE